MSQLLDPHLEGLIMPLSAALKEEATKQEAADIARVQGICCMVEVRTREPYYKKLQRPPRSVSVELPHPVRISPLASEDLRLFVY